MLHLNLAKKVFCCALFGLGLLTSVRANTPNDSVVAPLKPKWGFNLTLDNRNSFIETSPVKIYGVNAGMKYRERYRIGVGMYSLRNNYRDRTYVSTQNRRDTVLPLLDLYFLTPNFSYTLYNSPWLELSAPLEIGVGNSHLSVRNTQDKLIKERNGLFVPASVGLGLMFKPSRWIGVSTTAGYRKSLKEVDFKGDFDGWYYSYRLNIFLGNIFGDYQQFREKKRQSKEAIAPRPEF